MGRCVYYLDAAYPGTSSTLFVGSIRYATGYMHATSSGKAMLASMPEEALKEYLRHPLEKSTDMTITEPEQLAAEIEEVRRRGYATDNMEMDVGINCVGVAIRDRKGDVVGALRVSGPSPRFYEERLHQIADMLKACLLYTSAPSIPATRTAASCCTITRTRRPSSPPTASSWRRASRSI